MDIIPMEAGPLATMCYLVAEETTGKAIAIDAALESAELISSTARERNLKIEKIVLTHSHWDHAADAGKLKQLTGAEICIHKDDDYRLKDPMEHSVFALPFKLEKVFADRFLEHKDKLRIGSIEFEIRHTPGHTEGGICLVNHENKLIFAGDTLFYGSIGRVDFPGGSMNTLLKSIKQHILTLDDEFTVFCGHGPSTTVGEERKNNPFLNELSEI